jgi:myo-inositol 2-dehydrogenase/D-chiro-inositol 1-dehydrogenase
MVREPLRVGVLGLGAVARAVYLPLLAHRADLFEIAAVCDLSPALLDVHGDRHNVPRRRRHTDLGEMLDAGGLDAVIVLSSGSHAGAAQDIGGAGLPMLVEKPLAYTLAEVDGLKRPDLVQLGYMKLFDPAVRRAANLLADRPAPRSVEVTVLHPSMDAQLSHLPPAPPSPPIAAAAARRAAEELAAQRVQAVGAAAAPVLGPVYTDVILGSIVHNLYVLRALAGDPVRIGWAHTWADGGDPGSVECSGTLSGGGRVSIRWHYLDGYPSYREEVRVHDEQGSVELTFPSPYLLHAPTELRVSDAVGGDARVSSYASTREAFAEQLVAFHDRAVTGEPAEVTVEQGRRDIVTSQRIAGALAQQQGIAIGGEAADA